MTNVSRPARWIGLALLSTALGAACASECTLIACSPHVAIELSPELELSEGDKLEVTLHNETKVDCTARDSAFKCSDARVSWIFRGEETSSAEGTTQNAGGKPIGISVQGKPSTVVVRLFADGELTGEAEVKPKFQSTEINGPGCGECEIATATATLARP